MNIDPPVPFDPSEALALFAEPEQERYGLSDRAFFFAIITCRAVESFSTPTFTIDKVHGPGFVPMGCWIEFIIKAHVFWVDVSPTRVKLWTSLADDADALRNRYLIHDGVSDDAKAWENLLIEIGRVEKFGVSMLHADTLRRMWSEWLIEKRRRDDERGW